LSEHVVIEPAPGLTLADRLFQAGVEFPCGGSSACGSCRVRLVSGEIPITRDMKDALSAGELAAGWRLACQAEASSAVVLEIGQWSPRILTDEASVPVEPREGIGLVIDLGTTTLVAERVDLRTGAVQEVRTALNPQGRYGADVMSRIEFALRKPDVLAGLIRRTLGAMAGELASGSPLTEIVLCGNTVMHHLFCGESVEPLSHVPFQSPSLGARTFSARELGWPAAVRDGVTFLPCVGGFVGSDLLCGLVACGLHESERELALIDLGTNGEIAVGNRRRVMCASTAAGPAFEGGRIRMGTRAGDGAIDRVEYKDGRVRCHVLGGAAPRGVCGSGLVDAAAAALSAGALRSTGRLTGGLRSFPLEGPVEITQADFRELQLAKGAIAAGLVVVMARAEIETDQLAAINLAGAFGNYVRIDSARRIGLLPDWSTPVHPAGNSAVRGARMLLLAPSRRTSLIAQLFGKTRHLELASDPGFQEAFIANMAFPESGFPAANEQSIAVKERTL
jgi:uncharacterized 2Fe-2S/4Fe-4S cluster protein (DUF4445 family)